MVCSQRFNDGERPSVDRNTYENPLVTRYASREMTYRSAIFTLPVSIEIDRKGRLDQKGVGSPNMHPAPHDKVDLAFCQQNTKEV